MSIVEIESRLETDITGTVWEFMHHRDGSHLGNKGAGRTLAIFISPCV